MAAIDSVPVSRDSSEVFWPREEVAAEGCTRINLMEKEEEEEGRVTYCSAANSESVVNAAPMRSSLSLWLPRLGISSRKCRERAKISNEEGRTDGPFSNNRYTPPPRVRGVSMFTFESRRGGAGHGVGIELASRGSRAERSCRNGAT